MSAYHDPLRQENYLRQALAHDKKPLGIFLGAGAPMSVRVGLESEPLIPDIQGMTGVVSEALKDDRSFSIICTHIQRDDKKSDIEAILSCLRSFAQIVGRGEVSGLTASDLSELDRNICLEVNKLVNKHLPDRNSPYHKLSSWVASIGRTQPVEIFTTNYDLLLEQALEDLRVPYFDGFSGSRQSFFDAYSVEVDELPVRWARLWKLHGSINWRYNREGCLYRSIRSDDSDDRMVIHPSHLKYDESRKMPYLSMIDRLKAFVKKPASMLICCGYSFRDQHLNETIVQAMQANSSAIVFALMFGPIVNYPEASKLAEQLPNFSVLAFDGALIGTRRAQWRDMTSEDLSGAIATTNSHGEDGHPITVFKLGDFGVLGQFLNDVVGEASPRGGA